MRGEHLPHQGVYRSTPAIFITLLTTTIDANATGIACHRTQQLAGRHCRARLSGIKAPGCASRRKHPRARGQHEWHTSVLGSGGKQRYVRGELV